MTPEATDALTGILTTIIGSAPATVALLYLIYRQEAKETRILDALLNIALECYKARQKAADVEIAKSGDI